MPDDLDPTWPNRRAMVLEMSEVLGRDLPLESTGREWVRQGCPIPARKPIPKVPVYRWLLVEKRERGQKGSLTPAADAGETLKDKELIQRIRLLENKNMILEDQSWNRDEVTRAVFTAIEDGKSRLYTDLSAAAFDQAQDLTADQFEEWMRTRLDGAFDALHRFAITFRNTTTLDQAAADEESAPEKPKRKGSPKKSGGKRGARSKRTTKSAPKSKKGAKKS